MENTEPLCPIWSCAIVMTRMEHRTARMHAFDARKPKPSVHEKNRCLALNRSTSYLSDGVNANIVVRINGLTAMTLGAGVKDRTIAVWAGTDVSAEKWWTST